MLRALPVLLGLAAAAACGPKVSTEPFPYEQDDPAAGAPPAEPAPTYDELPVAPPGPGARAGTVERAALVAVLDQGPAAILRHVEVAAELDGDRFLGWRLVAIDPGHHPFAGVDLVPGDVLVALNGRVLSRPDELQAVWDGLRGADAIVADLRRDGGKVQLRWEIDGPPAPPPAPARR